MIRFILCWLLISSSAAVWAQTTGGLSGQVIDAEVEEGLPFANLILVENEFQIAATQSDLNGNYNFSNVPSGTYTLIVTYTGYPTSKTPNVSISAGGERRLDVKMSESVDITIIDIHADPAPVLCLTCEEPNKVVRDKAFIEKNPERGLDNTINSTSTVNAADEGEARSSGGSRTTSNLILVNGVPQPTGSISVADMEAQEVQVMTMGIPARYGNATGSITNIITRTPSTRFMGSVQAETSQFLDAFGATTINAFFSGPILTKPMINALGDSVKSTDGKVRRRSLLGYRISGAYFTTRDPRPSALGFYRLSDAALQHNLDNPLTIKNNGDGRIYSADLLTEQDVERVPLRANAQLSTANYNTTLEAKPNKDLFFSLNSQGQFQWGKIANVRNQLFNAAYNPDQRSNILGFTGRFLHTVSSTIPGQGSIDEEEDSEGLLQPIFQNLSYELIVSYNQTYFETEDPRHKDRFWDYGYIGKFHESRRPVIGIIDEKTGKLGHTAFLNAFDGYTPNRSINPGLAAYNDLIPTVGSNAPNAPTSLNEMEMVNGLITGAHNNVYGLFNAPHLTRNTYSKQQNSQYRAAVETRFELYTNQLHGPSIRHKIVLGGVFEQQIQRRYNLDPFALWNRAYQTTNQHIENAADPTRPTGETYFDPQSRRVYNLYQNLVREDENGNEVRMSTFAANLRQSLNLDKRDWIAVHELDPSQMQLEWFEPSTLITGNQRLLSYQGYDFLGNPLGADIAFNDFFHATDANGRKTRPVAPFSPIYVAGYIEDRFIYKDLICHVGLRVDRYDANTKVMSDPYSTVGYETAAEFESNNSGYTQGQTDEYQRPGNIGDNYAVYVNENSRDASVIGYRNGDQWYNAQGIPVNSPNELGATILPALKGFSTSEIDPKGDRYNPDLAFQDYTPELIVMPRISLSFPISEVSNFYANYDVLAQRPPVGTYASALDIYNFRELTTNNRIINNSSLRPEQTTNYEVGFQQRVTRFAKIRLALAYKEERHLIQVQRYIKAYPNSYTTFGNSDFSTTKIFKLEYETIRHKNLRIIANYALQFSEGTGSSPTSGTGVAEQELKYVFALDFDQRHTFYANFDYRFGSGDDYKGPKIGKWDVLENTGLSLVVNANSGRPYTRKAVPGDVTGNFSARLTDGSINGARTPWNFRVSLRLDRDFIIGKKSAKPLVCNVYLRVTNLLNTQNVLSVYPVTGSPTDDGFLTLNNSQGPGFAAAQPDSYAVLYGLRAADFLNISRPRRIFVGMSITF